MSISSNHERSGNSEVSSIFSDTESKKRVCSSNEGSSTRASAEVSQISSSEERNEAMEGNEFFMTDVTRTSASMGSKESIFFDEKYLRLGLEGPLPIHFERAPEKIPLALTVKHAMISLAPSHEVAPDDIEMSIVPRKSTQMVEIIELGEGLPKETMVDQTPSPQESMEDHTPSPQETVEDHTPHPDIELENINLRQVTQEEVVEPLEEKLPEDQSAQEVIYSDNEQLNVDMSVIEGEEVVELEKELLKDPLAHGVVYPDLELLPKRPLHLDYYKNEPDEENEVWATLRSELREEVKGTLNFLHLKRGLSKFSYEVFGFTDLNLSGKFLTDISLFARLPMTFTALTQVNLSHNKLVDISALSGLHTITHLDVSHNRLKKLLFMYPERYWNVDEPTKLDMERNVSRCIGQLSSSGWALCGLGISQLRWVNFSHNLVRSLEGPRHWAHFPHLAYLDLSHNHISDLRSEDPVLISGGAVVQSETDKQSISKCGLASLTLLHTLNISNNFISDVKGLNGLCVHNLILSNNSICSWEGETGQLYQESRYACAYDGKDIDSCSRETSTASIIIPPEDTNEETMTMMAESDIKFGEGYPGEGGEISLAGEFSEQLPIPEIIIPPTIRVTKASCVEGNGTGNDEHEVDLVENPASSIENCSSSKTVEVLFTEGDRKREKVNLEVLYQCKKPDWNEERSSEDTSVMKSCYLESHPDGDYTERRGRLEVLLSPQELKNSDEDQSDTGWGSIGSFLTGTIESVSCRISQRPGSCKINSASGCSGDEALPEFLSVSSMFDYEWEGYEPDDQCFAKVRKGQKTPARRRTTVRRTISPEPSKVEVLYQRDSLSTWQEGSGEGESNGDEEVLIERVYEEWDDPEVHVLLEPRFEPDSDYESRSTEVSQIRVESEERIKVLYEAECSEGPMTASGVHGTQEEDGMEVLFERGQLGALVEPKIPGRKSVEVLFRLDERLRESCIGLDEEEDEMSGEEERGEDVATVDRLNVFFDVYERVETDESDESSEVLSEVGERGTSTDESALEKSEPDETPTKVKVDLPFRVNANRFKEFVGIRSLKWLTELHLESNKVTSLKMFRGAYWLRSLFLQENFIEEIGEIMYLSELHQLEYLDMTDNPVSHINEFYEATIFLVPSLLFLNQVSRSDLGVERPQEVIFHKNPFIRATGIVKDLLLASEMRRENHLAWSCPELDALPYMHSPYPVLLLVGPEGSRNKELCQSLFERLPEKVYMSKLVTTKPSSEFRRYVSTPRPDENHDTENSKEHCEYPTSSFQIYRTVTKEKFLELLSLGFFACVTEDEGFLFGFDKCDAIRAASGGKVLVAAVNLTMALVLHLAEFYGKPRLVLILPESASLHEKNLRREWKCEDLEEEDGADINQYEYSTTSSDSKDSGCEVEEGLKLSGNLLAEQEFVRRNLEARQSCLTVHHENPGVFHLGVFSDNRESALDKLIAMVGEMHDERRRNMSLKNESGEWYRYRGSDSKDIDDLINARLERALRGCMPVWE
ncbi:uncharacterized protein LOC124156090 [Ischnura elegans]|uniref:uncharacterized protein LOC124156090 n=1 Tax=Ischnura elegans TaxID=197161 RepID=UPI001ED88720|nr:uncharacterized protein LOC124156090 [Ischnura elegans]